MKIEKAGALIRKLIGVDKNAIVQVVVRDGQSWLIAVGAHKTDIGVRAEILLDQATLTGDTRPARWVGFAASRYSMDTFVFPVQSFMPPDEVSPLLRHVWKPSARDAQNIVSLAEFSAENDARPEMSMIAVGDNAARASDGFILATSALDLLVESDILIPAFAAKALLIGKKEAPRNLFFAEREGGSYTCLSASGADAFAVTLGPLPGKYPNTGRILSVAREQTKDYGLTLDALLPVLAGRKDEFVFFACNAPGVLSVAFVDEMNGVARRDVKNEATESIVPFSTRGLATRYVLLAATLCKHVLLPEKWKNPVRIVNDPGDGNEIVLMPAYVPNATMNILAPET